MRPYQHATVVVSFADTHFEAINPDGTLYGRGTYSYWHHRSEGQIDYQIDEGEWPGTSWHQNLQFEEQKQGTVSGRQTVGGASNFTGRFILE